MCVACGVGNDIAMAHHKAIKFFTGIWMQSEIRVAAGAFNPLLVVAHHNHRSCCRTEVSIEPVKLFWVDAPGCLSRNCGIQQGNCKTRNSDP